MTFQPSHLSPPSPKGYGESGVPAVPETVPATETAETEDRTGLRDLRVQAALGAAAGGAIGYSRGASPLNYALGGAILVPALGAVHWWWTKPKAAKKNPLIPGFGASPMPCLGMGAPPSAPLGYLQNSIGGVREQGFGEKTKAALVAFQKSKGIYADGIAGPQTWASLGLPGTPCGGGTVQVGAPPPGSGGIKQVMAQATGATTETGKINWWFWAAMGLAGVVIWQNRKTIRRKVKGEKAPKRATVPIIPAAWQGADEEPETEEPEDLSFFEEDFEEPEAPAALPYGPEPLPIAEEPAPLMIEQRPEDDRDFIEAEWEDVEPEALPAPEEPIGLLPAPGPDLPDINEPPLPMPLAAKNRRKRRKKRKK